MIHVNYPHSTSIKREHIDNLVIATHQNPAHRINTHAVRPLKRALYVRRQAAIARPLAPSRCDAVHI